MNRRENIHKLLLYNVGIIALFALLSGCINERLTEDCNLLAEKTTLKFELCIPGQTLGATRGMSSNQEKAANNIQVLVFEDTGSEEVFRYKAPYSQKSEGEITVEAKVSAKNEKYRFVILANVDESINLDEGKTKQEILNQYLLECQGKWDTQPIPMWGECNETITVKKEQYLTILLYRALARVDVGLRFKEQTQDKQTEEVEGLNNFKINSIRVYRTKNQAYATTSKDKMVGEKINEPHIPPTAKYNSNKSSHQGYDNLKEADKDPLIYNINSTENPTGVDSYIREIYIPESIESTNGKSMDEVPCLVIGGFYEGSVTETYYRVDFATYTDGKIESYKPILRNNRYVINIKSVKNSGFKEPEHALNSINTQMTLDVQAWNEKPLDIYIQGDYFFQIDSRDVTLEARGTVDPEGIFTDTNISLCRVPFKTNLTLNEKNIKYKWESDGENAEFKTPEYVDVSGGNNIFAYNCPNTTEIFGSSSRAYINVDKGRIMFGASSNIGKSGKPAEIRSDVLYLQIKNFEFSIKVTQKAININYSLLCNTIQVHGKYRQGIPLNYTNYITLQIEAKETINAGEEIEIYTETRKGIHFIYKETISETIVKGEKRTVKLQGMGTPTPDPNDPNKPDQEDSVMSPIEDLRISSNSIEDNGCETRIFFGYQTKRILTIGANAIFRYGYMLEPNTGSRAFVDASINFGTDPNSAVTMEQFPEDYPIGDVDAIKSPTPGGQTLNFNSAKNNAFHVEFMSTTNGRMGSFERIKNEVLKDLLENFKPHIILTGQAISYQDADIALIVDFVNKGGVFLMFNEYYPSVANTNKMVQALLTTKGNGSNQTTSYSNIYYELANTYEKDPILEGPFYEGSLAGKGWGSDGICLHGFQGLDENEVRIYSKRSDGAALFFQHKTKPFVFIGDGGFISNSNRYIGDSFRGSYVYCPFAINSAYQPIPRVNYRNEQDKTVYNSQLFGNILTWAVDWAESEKGIKYK